LPEGLQGEIKDYLPPKLWEASSGKKIRYLNILWISAETSKRLINSVAEKSIKGLKEYFIKKC
jgi:hypothetical protein